MFRGTRAALENSTEPPVNHNRRQSLKSSPTPKWLRDMQIRASYYLSTILVLHTPHLSLFVKTLGLQTSNLLPALPSFPSSTPLSSLPLTINSFIQFIYLLSVRFLPPLSHLAIDTLRTSIQSKDWFERVNCHL